MAADAAKVKWNQHAIDDDIDYLGPLSYRHFKIIGWLLFVMKMLMPPLSLIAKVDPGSAEALALPLGAMQLVTPLSVFFLLIASFSQLLIKKDYKRQMITNGGAALAIILVFNILFHRYIVSSVDAFVGNRDESLALCDAAFSSLEPAGFIAFNVFVDLFLCTCVIFFLKHEPTKFFVGNRLKWFRCCAVLPIVFELVCLWLKLQANSGGFHMPISFFPFLPTKPPMMFFAICAMIIYEVLLERRFRKEGRTHEEYEAYLNTNRNCWEFAKFAAIACLVAAVLDTLIAFTALANDPEGGMDVVLTLLEKGEISKFYGVVYKYFNAGFGGSMDLILFAPIMLLFNYSKTYENTLAELAIPVVAITLLVILYLEGGLFAISEVARYTRTNVMTFTEDEVLPAIIQTLDDAGREYDMEFNSEEFELLLSQTFGEEDQMPEQESKQGSAKSPSPQSTSAQAPAKESNSKKAKPQQAPA